MKGPPPTLKKIQAVTWALWGAMTAAPIIYATVLRNVHLASPSNAPPPVPHQPMGFIALGIFLGFMSLVVRGLFLGRIKLGAIPMDSEAGMRTYLTGYTLCFAFSEAVGVLGLMLGFLGYSDSVYEGFLLSSVGLMLFHIPLPDRLDPRG